jgi:hypothetical protein
MRSFAAERRTGNGTAPQVSARVRAGVVTGSPRYVVMWLGGSQIVRRALTPLVSRSALRLGQQVDYVRVGVAGESPNRRAGQVGKNVIVARGERGGQPGEFSCDRHAATPIHAAPTWHRDEVA